jgi:NAD(P)H-flavin reductase
VRLLWGVRSADRLFDIPHLQALSDRHPRFAWETWIEKPGSEGAGHVGDIVDAISSLDWDAAEIAAAQVFIGGRREMATAARAALVCRGFSSHHMFSD